MNDAAIVRKIDQLLSARRPDRYTPRNAKQSQWLAEIAKEISSEPARRRARALVANGWPVAQLAGRGGIDRQVLDRLVTGGWQLTTARTAYAVLHLYEQLWNENPPAGRGSTLAKARARQLGWPAPMEMDDDTVDDDALTEAELAAYRSGGTS
jgi:hypothetical protein